LFDVRQEVEHQGGEEGPAVVAGLGRQTALRVVGVLHRQTDLSEVVLALGACGGLADFLHGGQQQADQDGDDGDHHQQLDQREADSRGRGRRTSFTHDRTPSK
jgi:hypothetical protein